MVFRCLFQLEAMARKFDYNPEFLKDFIIPNYILQPETEVEKVHVPNCPVLVFINSRSGGQLGGSLLTTYRSLLNQKQVFDLGEEAPDKVLYRFFLNLEKLKLNRDEIAVVIQRRLRLIVAGGDGTAGWLLGVVCDLKLSYPPPIATMPLGTGNNLPFAFGWGKKNPGTDPNSVVSFLEQVLKAKEMKVDNWHILMRMRVPKKGSCDAVAPLELPHSLHAFHRANEGDEHNVGTLLVKGLRTYGEKYRSSRILRLLDSQEGCLTFRGGFWNYFSMGMDAQVSYAFHSERKLHPEKFKNQLVNQSIYAKIGSTWFFAPLFHPSSKNIAQIAKVEIMKCHGGDWQKLQIPHRIRSIICLNLPSFSGGLNPWGTPNNKTRSDRDLNPPYVNDGLLEVVGFRDAWHGLALLTPKGHGTRLAQAHGIRFVLEKCAAGDTYMRIDGEPWKQPLPANESVTVEISHLGQVDVLATHNCRSKSVNDSSTPSRHGEDSDEEYFEEDSTRGGEEFRKFGATATFKIPDEFDFSHLS